MAVAALSLLVVLSLRVIQVQGLNASRYAAYGQAEQYTRVTLPSLRGTIYDRNGNVLAISVPRYDVIADDFLVASRRAALGAAPRLARALDLPAARVLSLLSEKSGYVPLALDVTKATEQKVASFYLPFVSFVPSELREDPSGNLFSPILGIVGYANKGLSGLEYVEQRALVGRQGSEELAIGSNGGALPGGARDVRPATQGTSLVLTLDEPLQYEVTKALSAQLLAQKAFSASVVVLDTRTGGILAMVNLVRQGNRVVPASQNLATNTVYEPGSVMKIATFSGALQDHVITPDTQLRVPFTIYLGGWPFQDAWYHPTEYLPAYKILALSSNVGTIEIAHMLGPTRLDHYLHALGFGRVSPLNWPGESAGLLPPLSQWQAVDMGTFPIGTGEAVTPLQIVDAYNTVANGGVYVPPHLVEATVGPNGKEHILTGYKGHRVLDASTVAELVPMMEDVTKYGTGVLARIPGYLVAGKTGTAQIPYTNKPGYQPGAWNATFVGFVPANNPALTAVVVMHHPLAMYGGSASAPVFQTIMKYALRHFDISPSGATAPSALSSSPVRP